MGAAVGGGNDVDERLEVFGERIVVLKSDFDFDLVDRLFDVNGGGEGFFVAVQVDDQGFDTAFKIELLGDGGGLGGEREMQTGDEISAVADRVFDIFGVPFHGGKHGRVGLEFGESAGVNLDQGVGIFGDGDGTFGNTPAVLLAVDFAVPADFDPEVVGESVNDGGSNAVQTAGNFVGRFVKLAAGVELGHGEFQSGNAGFVFVHRNAAAVVLDGDGPVLVKSDPDVFGKTGQGFVDRVVDDFSDEVVEAFAVGRADVHAGALSNRLQSF